MQIASIRKERANRALVKELNKGDALRLSKVQVTILDKFQRIENLDLLGEKPVSYIVMSIMNMGRLDRESIPYVYNRVEKSVARESAVLNVLNNDVKTIRSKCLLIEKSLLLE